MSEHITDRAQSVAIGQLQRFVLERADSLRSSVGFGYRPSPIAPTSFEELQREHSACQSTRLPLRVAVQHNPSVVLGRGFEPPFRFWHDLTHISLRQDFTRQGEIMVGQEQLRQAASAGHQPGSLVWRLLFAETIGQTECCHRLGVFPADQARFTRDYLTRGLPEAILLEARRQHLVIMRGFQRRRDNEVIGSQHHQRSTPAEHLLLGDEPGGLGDAA